MKQWPPRTPRTAPTRRRRIPMFHPVPVGRRADGWTVQRQADLIGWLYETRSVLEACRRVGMGRESAYRLRKRPGAAGFAAAWDAALGKPHEGVDLASAKATGLPAHYRWEAGRLKVVTNGLRYAGAVRVTDDDALLQHLAQCDRSDRAGGAASRKPHSSRPGSAVHVRAPGGEAGSGCPASGPGLGSRRVGQAREQQA